MRRRGFVMKSIQLVSFGHHSLAEAAQRPVGLADLMVWLGRCMLRSRGRSSLAELDDRLLSDIGVSRAEARRESNKPFWR
ncbi:MAG: DUF1127 domain-containing protein [Geminicoccaceae bacterium]